MNGMPTRSACSRTTLDAARLVPTNRILLPRDAMRFTSASAPARAWTVASRLMMWILLRAPKMYSAIFGFQKRV